MPFPDPGSRIESNIQESTAEIVAEIDELTATVSTNLVDDVTAAVNAMSSTLASKLDTVISGIAGLQSSLSALQGNTDGLEAKLDTIITKLAGGLPSVLSSDKLKVTGLL